LQAWQADRLPHVQLAPRTTHRTSKGILFAFVSFSH
jgi:hypothetical protein